MLRVSGFAEAVHRAWQAALSPAAGEPAEGGGPPGRQAAAAAAANANSAAFSSAGGVHFAVDLLPSEAPCPANRGRRVAELYAVFPPVATCLFFLVLVFVCFSCFSSRKNRIGSIIGLSVMLAMLLK